MNIKYIISPILCCFFLGVQGSSNINYKNTTKLSSSDYLLGENNSGRDPVFDVFRTVDLKVDLGIGQDCGRINVKSTLKAALKNILDTKYLGDMGKNILAASPMLLTCYLSPTWCSILKNARLRANFLAELRLNQCGAINKYVDMRASDFYEERSRCIQNAISKNNGNFETAMDQCKNFWKGKIQDWAGKGTTLENRLIESTAKWAGFKGKEADRVVSLTKSLIGDTIIKRGIISVDYGPGKIQLTPRTYLEKIRGKTYDKLCKKIVAKIQHNGLVNVYRDISDKDLKDLSGHAKNTLLDRQTIQSLSYLPHKKRKLACKKLASALSLDIFSKDMARALDFVSAKMGTNPHLPKIRKEESERKRKVLKDQFDVTLAMEKNSTPPLNQVLAQINKEGESYRSIVVQEGFETEKAAIDNNKLKALFFDGADQI